MRHATEFLVRELIHFITAHYDVHGPGWRADHYREKSLELWREKYGDTVADRIEHGTAKLAGQPERIHKW
ncbi:MAG TPA: hypothetical protein VHQ92_13495 [Pseudolabrys sp.]|jgi:hypothetical protein|nr:hypothetical protein [Pseudolabrys sp.]